MRHLGCVELFDRHTSTNLSTHVISVLEKFKISMSQVYCITTDNAANMKKMSKILDMAVEHEEDEEEPADFNLEDDLAEEDLVTDLTMSINENYPEIAHVPCAVHTLQLSIQSFIQTKENIVIWRETLQKSSEIKSE